MMEQLDYKVILEEFLETIDRKVNYLYARELKREEGEELGMELGKVLGEAHEMVLAAQRRPPGYDKKETKE